MDLGGGEGQHTKVSASLCDFREVLSPLWTLFDGSGLEQRFFSLLMGSRAALWPGGLETGPLRLGNMHSSGAQLLAKDQSPALGSTGGKPGLWQNMVSNTESRQSKRTAPRAAGRAASLDWSWQDPLKLACILEGKLTGGTSNGWSALKNKKREKQRLWTLAPNLCRTTMR